MTDIVFCFLALDGLEFFARVANVAGRIFLKSTPTQQRSVAGNFAAGKRAVGEIPRLIRGGRGNRVFEDKGVPMNNISSEPESQSVVLGRAVRFGFAAIVLGMSYPNIRLAFGISAFRAIFKDMLGGKPLPAITTLVLQAQPFLIGLSVVIPLVAISFIFIGRLTHSIYVSGVLLLAVFFQLFFTCHAISVPLLAICQGMAGGSP